LAAFLVVVPDLTPLRVASVAAELDTVAAFLGAAAFLVVAASLEAVASLLLLWSAV
jgi:hypothetical protein